MKKGHSPYLRHRSPYGRIAHYYSFPKHTALPTSKSPWSGRPHKTPPQCRPPGVPRRGRQKVGPLCVLGRVGRCVHFPTRIPGRGLDVLVFVRMEGVCIVYVSQACYMNSHMYRGLLSPVQHTICHQGSAYAIHHLKTKGCLVESINIHPCAAPGAREIDPGMR